MTAFLILVAIVIVSLVVWFVIFIPVADMRAPKFKGKIEPEQSWPAPPSPPEGNERRTMNQWTCRGSRIVRGMVALRDRCPEHGALPIWYSVVEMTVSPMRIEVARYDCGCMVTVDVDTMGATAVRESVVRTDETVGE